MKHTMDKAKRIKINNVEIPVVVGNRALVEYKRETGRNTILDIEDALRLTWHGLKSGAKQSGLEFKMSFEDWIDYTDAHPEISEDMASTNSANDASTGSPTNEATDTELAEGKKKATT